METQLSIVLVTLDAPQEVVFPGRLQEMLKLVRFGEAGLSPVGDTAVHIIIRRHIQ